MLRGDLDPRGLRPARAHDDRGGDEPRGGGAHSVFAQILIETLQTNDGVLLGRDVFQRVQLRVNAMAQRWAVPQVPEYAPIKYAGHEGGDFFFLRTGT